MAAIQAIFIRDYEQRPTPSPHTVYRIEVHASVRSWQIWRRYSEFADLHLDLAKSTGSPPPAPLPPKHAASFLLRRQPDPARLEERREGLERYLRAILSAKDDTWRETFAFRDFLGIPIGKQPVIGSSASASGADDGTAQFTSSSWLDEQRDLQSLARDVRADINRRDALAAREDVAPAHAANAQAKKKLAALGARLGALDAGLRALGLAGMSEGELVRRADMVARLRDECEGLARVLTVARLTSSSSGGASRGGGLAPTSDREALLEGGGGGGASSGFARPTRRFGAQAPPEETAETRPLDEHGVFQLQAAKMQQQDTALAQLSTVLTRQKHLGLAINEELQVQTEMLDDLNSEVDRVGGRLTSAKKKLNKLS